MWERGNCRWAQNVLSTSQKNWRGTELKVTAECIIRLLKFESEIHNSLKGPFHRIDTLLLTGKSSSWWPHFISEWNLPLISWCQPSPRLSHSAWQAGKWGAEQHLLLSLKNTDSGAHQSVPVHCKSVPRGLFRKKWILWKQNSAQIVEKVSCFICVRYLKIIRVVHIANKPCLLYNYLLRHILSGLIVQTLK